MEPTSADERWSLANLGFVRVDGLQDQNCGVVRPAVLGSHVVIDQWIILTLPNGEVWLGDFYSLVLRERDCIGLYLRLGANRTGRRVIRRFPPGYCQQLNPDDYHARRDDPDYLPSPEPPTTAAA